MISIRRFIRPGSALAALALSLTIPVAATAADPVTPGLSCEVDAFDAGLGAWSTAFLGDAAQGGATVVDGVLRVTSDGSELFHGDDSGLFVHRRIDGDFRVEIDVTGVPGDTGGTYRKGCLMVRGTIGADGGTGVRDPRLMACFVPHFPTPDVPAYQFDVRFGDGDEATELASAVTEVPVPTPGTPARFALTRLGNRVTVSYSADGGVSWIEPRGAAGGEVTIDLGDVVEAGVMVASYDPAQTATFDFDRFRACHLDGYPTIPEPTPAGEAPVCEAGTPYDIVYLLDLSESMTAAFSGAGGGAPETKLDAARTALERIHGQIGVRGDGSRAALLTFSGRTEEPDHNLANALDVRVPLTSDLASVDAEIRSLAPSGIPGRTTTPTALALQGTLDVLRGVADPARQTVLVLLTDGIPNVDDEGRGPDAYALREIQNIALTDADGAFLPWERIAWSGAYNGATDTFDGEPLGDAVRALDELAEGLDGLLVFGVGLRGDGEGLGTFKDELVQYAAHVTGGRSFAAADAPALITAADQILTDLDCGAPGTVSVGDRLWNDLDADGVEDAGEPGLAGVTIRVENAGGSSVATTVSDLSGGWLVRGLAAGTYTVRIDDATLPSGLSVPTHDLDGLATPHAATLTLEAFEVRRDVDFGYRRGGSTDPTDPGTTICTVDGFDGPDPDGWSLTAIGGATVGDMAIVDQRLHLTSNGPALWDDDRFHFVHRSVAGDFRVEVDVADLIDGPTGRSFRKGGLMIRGAADGSDDDAFDVRSPRIMVQYLPNLTSPAGPKLQFGYRTAQGQGSESLSFIVHDVTLPVRLAIERRGSTYTAYYSYDGGASWQLKDEGFLGGTVDLDLGDLVQVGFSVASYDASTPMTLAFDDFATCAPDLEPVAPPPAVACDAARPLDLVYLLDVSGSMGDDLGGAARIEAARDALARLHGALSGRGDGSRAALVTYAGGVGDPSSAVTVLSGLTPSLGGVAELLAGLDASDVANGADTPSATGLFEAGRLLADGLAPGHRPAIVWLTDSPPNVDLFGGGPYADEGVDAGISLVDADGEPLAPGRVAWQGPFLLDLGVFAGEPVAHTMAELARLRATVPGLEVHALALSEATSARQLADYAAFVTGGSSAAASDGASAVTGAERLWGDLGCGAPVDADDTPPTVTVDQPAPTLDADPASCRAPGAPVDLGGIYFDANPSSGTDGAPPPVTVEVRTTDGTTSTHVATLAAEGGRWSVVGVDLGSAAGIATIEVTGVDSSGNTARATGSWRVDAAPPSIALLLDGAPFPGAAAGATPPAGQAPTRFARAVAVDVQVTDDPSSSPPLAVLTLDGQPYAAGTPIAAEGDHLVVARAVDCAGREVVAHAAFRVDTTPPRLLSSQPTDGADVGSAVAAFVGTSDPDLATATVDGQLASLTGAGAFETRPFAWVEGLNTVAIELVDTAGNRSTHVRTFTVSTVPLGVEIVESGVPIVDGAVFLRPVRPEIQATDGSAAITATLDGASFVSGTEIAAAGTYTLNATATLGSGGAARTATDRVTFTVDPGDGPTIDITSPEDATFVADATVEVSGTVTGVGVGTTLTVEVDGVPATVSGGPTSGTFRATVPLDIDAYNSIEAVATDVRGRRAVDFANVFQRDVGPTILIFEPADGAVTNRDRTDVVGVVVDDVRDLRPAEVTVTGPGGAVTAAVASDGAFRAIDVPLITGDNPLVVAATDRHDRVGSATVTVFADGTPPTIAIVANGRPLDDGAVFGVDVTVTVTAVDDSGVDPTTTVRLNGAGQDGAGAETTLQITEDGGYLVSVLARDGAGNEARAERSFVLDRGGCSITEVEPVAGAGIADDRVTLRGRSGEAVTVSVRVPGAAPEVYAAQVADGTFLAADLPLPIVGTNALEISCTDAGGRSDTIAHPIERLPAGSGPVIDFTAPLDGARLGGDFVDLLGTVTAGASVTVNGRTADLGSGTFSVTAVPLAEGPNLFGARAVDSAGRVGTDRVVVFRDSQPPQVTITSPDRNAAVGIAGDGPATVDVTGTVAIDDEPNLDRVVVRSAFGEVIASVDDSGRFIALAVPLDASVPAGEPQTLTAEATDTHQQVGTSTVDVRLDPAGPAIILSAPADLTRYTETSPAEIAVAGEAWGADGSQISLNGGFLDPADLAWEEAGADGRRHVTFTATLPMPVDDGAFGLIARVVDPEDRHAQVRRLLFRDSVAPEVVEILPADGAEGVDPNTLLLVLFSEPIRHASLVGPDGLTLERQSTGEVVVGTATVAGTAVGFAPGAELVRGETYVFRAGPAITDVVGHPLVAPAQSTFTVAPEPTAAAPTVDPLPTVLCADQLEVTGTATPNVQVKVRDGSLTFSDFADATGAFSVTLPLSTDGFHLLHVFAVDSATGASSPETSLVVRVDCSAPTVLDATFDRATGVITARFSERLDPTTATIGTVTDAIRVRDAEDPAAPLQGAELAFVGERDLEIRLSLDPAAFWRDRPVRLQIGPPAADAEGNVMLAVFETVFFPGATGDLSGGFLFGETYDDTTGRPLAAASARLYPVGVGLPGAVADAAAGAPLFSVSTEGRGRYTLVTASPSQVPAGRYALLLSKDGFTSVVRHLALEPTRGLVPLDARLTPLALAAGSLDPIAGGSATADGLGLDADPAALPGTDALDVTLTRLSGQGLPDVLPLGWTPAGVVDVRLDGAGGAVPQADAFAGSVRVTLPLDAWVLPGDALVAAQYDLASGTWKALGLPQVDAGIATVEIPSTGAVAVLRADTDPAIAPPSPSAVGEALQGVERPTSTPDFDADLVLDPPVIPPTGRSRARVVARSADGSTVWPSGLAVQAFLEERLVLAAGQGQLLEAPFSADLLLYQPRLTPAERGGVADGAAGALDFVVSPSPRAAQVLLDVGFESIRLYGFPDLVDRGSQVGPTGGTVGDPDGVELEIPEGALTGETVATAELLGADALAELPAVEGFDTVAAVRIDLQGRSLGRAATVRLPAPDGLPAALAGDPRLILATFVDAPGDFRGDFARLVARVARQGSGASTRLVAGPAVDGGLLLDGVRGEGTYLVLWARGPIGFATGRVLGVGASALVDARVVTDGLGTADQSREGGRYLVPVVAGAAPGDPANLHALHPSTDERGSATASVAAGQSVDLDLQLARTPPRVLDFQPADGATDQPTLLTPTIQWSEALDPSSVAEGQMQIELADADFRGTGLFVSGTVELSPDGTRLSFASDRPLPPGRRYVARFNGGVRDLDGTPYDGPLPLVRRFTTSTVVAPGGQVRADRFHVELPTDGVVRIWADPGAVPLAQAGQADWSISPYIVGPRPGLDPMRDTYPARADGSFEASVGRPPEFPVTFDSEVWVAVLDPSGQKAAEFRLGPFTTADGKGFVAPAGEAITFRSAEGITVDVPAGAFDQGTLVTVSIQDPPPAAAVALAGQLGLGPAVALDFAGTAKETLRLSLPAPADAVLGKQVFFGEILNVAWGERLRMTSYGEVADLAGQRVLTNRPEYQAEPDPSLLDAVRSEGAPADAFATAPETRASTKMDDGPPKTCADIKSRGLGRCFAQDLLIEMLQASLTVSFYELGVDYALLTGPAAVLPLSWGAGMEILAEKIFDQWVFLPKPMDSRAGFWILPVPVDEPLTMVRRDAATGWVIGEQAYDPIPGDGASAGVAVVDPLLGVPPAPPMLVGVEPFDFVRFTAPPKDTESRLRLEIEVRTDGHDRSRLDGVAPYDLPDHTGLQVFDLEPLQPKPDPDDPDAPAEPKPPIAGPRLVVCDNGTTWSTSTFEATDDLLAIVSPGDLDPEDLEIITLEFDRAIDSELEDKEPDQVAVLTDLGPYDGCQVGGPGYPRTVQLEPRVVGDGRSVALIAASTLSSGHRFRLTLVPSAFATAGTDPQETYWSSGPKVFEFATRDVPGDTLGSTDPGTFPFDGISTARSSMTFGNLMLVGSDTGTIVAFDVSDVDEEGRFRPHAIKSSFAINARTFATDGHNRLFYTSIFGGVWAVKTIRAEDAREADATCPTEMPSWAQNLDCFQGLEGSIRVSTMPRPGGTTAAGFVASGAMPSGNPSDLEVLVRDEVGRTLELETFYETYTGNKLRETLQPDDEGIYTFDLDLLSTFARSESGEPEPSLEGSEPAVPDYRTQLCDGEEAYDRYQRVTVDNLTTGQSWSFDIENPWPSDADARGDGTYTLSDFKARPGDLIRVRYNLQSLGYLSIIGSGISVVDLNRGYRLIKPVTQFQSHQCGRRLGKFEGATIDFPACSIFGSGPEGLRYTTAVAPLSETGCETGQCRGGGWIDLYTPLLRVGAVHTASPETDPGGIFPQQLAACISEPNGIFAYHRDVAIAKNVEWIDNGLRGTFTGAFSAPTGEFEPVRRRGDLLFLSMGMAGVFVFDITDRRLDESKLIGLLYVDESSSLLMQVDPLRGLLYVGGNDYADSKRPPVIHAWDIQYVNSAPNTDFEPQPRLSVNAPWDAGNIRVDATGTGLLYTYDRRGGPVAVPIDRPRFTFSGLYLPDEEDVPSPAPGERATSIQRITQEMIPLGVPMDVDTGELDEQAAFERRLDQERAGTAAFKLRLALPGSFGDEITAKVQSLRVLPDERHLGGEDVGAAVALPGGPGWPDHETVVTLRRIGIGEDENAPAADVRGEAGQFATVYNLYESQETVLLLADPRARRDYTLADVPDQDDVPGSRTADEKAQCRRCDYPVYFPDVETDPDHPDLDLVEELLAGRYVRAFLFLDPDSPDTIRQNTRAALDFFATQGDNYPLPTGWVETTAPAAPVPSPLQVSLAEPGLNAATWSPGEASVSVSLTAGEAIVQASDHNVSGRSMPFSFDRTYRSHMLGYGPLGSAGWGANLFARLREIRTTGEVELYDGAGHVWRFYPNDGPLPDGWEEDPAGSYAVPKGVYLRLQKLAGDRGWRLIDRHHNTLEFDIEGRLARISDRHRRGGDAEEQGSTLHLFYDPFGQLERVHDDLGRDYFFTYLDDPTPTLDGGDGERYGLLETITDFVDREIRYTFSTERTLDEVELPEVKNPVSFYAEFSYEGSRRPTVRYEYDPQRGVSSEESNDTAVSHGDFAELRLENVFVPEFISQAASTPRVRFEYETTSGRVKTVAFPTPQNTNSTASSVAWTITSPAFVDDMRPVEAATVRAPWGHDIEYTLVDGRSESVRQELLVNMPDGNATFQTVGPEFEYLDDGRVSQITQPDGGQTELCYPDSCDASGRVDRLTLANVVKATTSSTEPGRQGTADYTSIVTTSSYQEDNLVTSMTDGLNRAIDVPVPISGGEDDALRFVAEGVRASLDYDAFGRSTDVTGGGVQPYTVRREFHPDAEGEEDAGLLKRVEQGTFGAPQMWTELDYDEQYNVDVSRTSRGTSTETTHDAWDRPVRVVSGLGDGRVRSVGTSECGEAPGAVVERAYDAAGHVIRERQLQDFVDVDGSVQCRFVETRYEYNAREQLTSVETTHLSDPARPGHVSSLSRRVSETRYDEHGRVREQRALNVVDPTLITRFRYDEAGRQVGVRVGDAGETTLGWDVKGRVVLRTDGDEGVWRGRYDAWDRLFHEAKATGGVVLHRFDESGQPIEVTSWDADPLAPAGDAELLAQTKTEYTSFGEMARLVEVLIDQDGERQVRVTEREFDDAGRLDRVLSGPAKVNADELDHARARREQAFRYEDLTGRLIEIAYGGEIGAPSEYVERFTYSDGTASPVPDAMARFESVPGEAGLVETWSERYVRDAFDRVIETRRNDGTVIYTTFDRGTQQVIRTRTGADTITRYGYDGVGRLVRQIRPNGRGATLYAYDTDGRIREQIAETRDAAEPWETRYTYDSTGRLLRTDYADDSFETVERYALDNQVLERTTRDGVRLLHTYDPANRLVSVVPSATARMASTLAPLDGGNASAWDTLSRPTRLDRGRPGVPDADPQLSVAYPSYDLASRVGTERVGGRAPIRWSYDEWNRPVTVDLPVGIGRADGAFRGFERRYDTLNRPVDVAALGGELTATRSGLTWTWGGLNRLYGFDTKGALGTASRTGYIDGRGPQPPDGNPDSAVWRPGTLTWGAHGTTAGSPTAVPATTWGQFAFGWRGTEGDPRDGVKIGRLAVRGNADGLDAFAGMGWSWDYDAGLRLSSAVPGRGDLQGRRPPRQAGFRYDYARGDELDRLVDEAAGTVGDVDSGAYGRITGRDGIDFGYDPAGRRTEDDRFVYTWNWRGELVEVAVKSGWDSPHEGHVVRYLYDASGRLHAREQWGAVPDGGGERPFVERREYVWEGQNLRVEVGFADPEATQARWRKTYVPGTGFDAPQVMVEDLAFPGDGPRLYTYLRDELGSVLGVVAERESADPRQPVIPARFFYTPYGEAYAESRPELRRGFFDAERTQVGGDEQRIDDPELAAPGTLLVDVSAALDPSTVPSGFAVESHGFGGWRAVDPAQVLVAPDDDSTRVAISLRSGWRRGERYRVRPLPSLRDLQGRGLGSAEPIEWIVPAEGERSIAYDRHFAVRFDSAAASADTLGGRFPGGQNHLFHGLWTDPVTGVAYARARWYDPRNATWLSEDPMHDVDSPNLYAYVGWSPAMFVDPFGEESIRQWLDFDKDIEEGRKVEGYAQKTLYVVWNAVTFGFLGRHDKDYEETGGYFGDNREEYIAQTGRNLGRTAVEGGVSMATGGWGSAGARTLGSAVARGAAGGAASGIATTAAADLYERATGGEAMTVSDYVSGAVGGALFGGATGAFGAGTRADELWYKPNGTAKSTGWSNVTTRMNRRYHQQVHGTTGTRNPRVHDEYLDEAVAGERHHGVMAQRETGMLTGITDRVAPGLTPVIERFANRNTVLLSKTRHRMADRHAGGPGQGYELPWYLSGPVMKWNPYRVWLGLTPRWRAWGGVAVVGVGWSSYGATRGVMDAIEGED